MIFIEDWIDSYEYYIKAKYFSASFEYRFYVTLEEKLFNIQVDFAYIVSEIWQTAGSYDSLELLSVYPNVQNTQIFSKT